MDFLAGPGFGYDRNTVSILTYAHIIVQALSTPEKLWRVMNGPTSEVWFDHWREQLVAKGVQFKMNHSLEIIDHDGNSITGAYLRHDDTIVHLTGADHYVIAINPNNLEDIFKKSNMPELAEQHANLQVTNNQIGFQIAFSKKYTFPIKSSGYALIDSPYNITFYPQEDHWKMKLPGTLISGTVIASYNNGSLFGKPATSLNRNQLIQEIIYQILESNSLRKDVPLDQADIIYAELYDEWTWNGEKLISKYKKWVNTVYNDTFRPGQLTKYSSLYLAGAHTKTSMDSWSMEAAAESGKIVSKHIAGNIFIRSHDLPIILEGIHMLDSPLASIGLPHVIDWLFIILLIFTIYWIAKHKFSLNDY
jgi:hypothetical protein